MPFLWIRFSFLCVELFSVIVFLGSCRGRREDLGRAMRRFSPTLFLVIYGSPSANGVRMALEFRLYWMTRIVLFSITFLIFLEFKFTPRMWSQLWSQGILFALDRVQIIHFSDCLIWKGYASQTIGWFWVDSLHVLCFFFGF